MSSSCNGEVAQIELILLRLSSQSQTRSYSQITCEQCWLGKSNPLQMINNVSQTVMRLLNYFVKKVTLVIILRLYYYPIQINWKVQGKIQ